MKTIMSPLVRAGLALAAAPLLLLSAGAAPNLIPNGDFESPQEKGAFPNWRTAINVQKNPGESFVLDGTPGKDVHGGKQGLKLYVSESGAAGTDVKQRNVAETVRSGRTVPEPPIKVEPGKSYTFSFWVKREGFGDPSHTLIAQLSAFPFPASGSEGATLALINDMKGPCDWEKKEVTVTVPADSNATEGYLIFRLLFPPVTNGQQADAYIDDVELVEN